MFSNFDRALLRDPEFKEDAVREVIIAPMLARLGYHPSGPTRVARSRALTHPFIYVGTRKHPVTTIPDYLLLHEDKPLLALDAKRPSEDILAKEHVQQAYSYAIHPEIRCQHFALCNGRSLVVFGVDEPRPILSLDFDEFESRWHEIEKCLAPRILLNPFLRKFAPDFGLKLSRMGFAEGSTIIVPGIRLGLFARVSDELFTASSNCDFGDEPHMVSVDFDASFLPSILAGLPPPLAEAFTSALSRSPFHAHGDLLIEADLRTSLGSETQGADDTFIPLVVQEVLGSRFNLEPVPSPEPTDIPPYVFRLSRAFTVRTRTP